MMNAVDVLGAKSDKLTDLPATTVFALAAKSTPDAVRADVLQRIEDGSLVDSKTVLALVGMGRSEAKRDDRLRRQHRNRVTRKELLRRRSDPKYMARQQKREEREEREAKERQRVRDEAVADVVGMIVAQFPAERLPDLLARWEAAGPYVDVRAHILARLPAGSMGAREALSPLSDEGRS